MKKKSNRIERAEAIELLASRLRQEIVDTLEARGGEASVSELAIDQGKPADGLYYHLRLLTKGGLLVEVPGKSKAGRDERRYRLVKASDERFSLVYRPKEKRNKQAVGRVVDSMLRIAGRDFHAGLAHPDTVVEGDERELWAARGKGWVDRAELREINRLLNRLNDLLNKKKRSESDRLISLCYVLAPIEAQPARRDASPE